MTGRVGDDAEPDEKSTRDRAVFTVVQDEAVLLPVWLDYYQRYFEAGDMYVLDHGSADGCTSGLGSRCHVLPVHRELSFDHTWLRSVVESFQRFLLRSYETVLFAEVDELVVADPDCYDGLDTYISHMATRSARCLGYNVTHSPGEQPLRFDRPLLAQRGHWHPSRLYSKRLLSRVPLRWSRGFHEEYDEPGGPPDPRLVLVHLHRIDFDSCLARHRASAARSWNPDDVAAGRGAHNRVFEPEAFERWFRSGGDLDGPPEPIPERFRKLF